MEKTSKYIDFLLTTANEFLELTSGDNIYLKMTEHLKVLLPNSIIMVSSVDDLVTTTTVESITGMNQYFEKIVGILGQNPIGSQYQIKNESKIELYSGKLHLVKGGIYELSFEKINKIISRALEKIVSINQIYAIGIVSKEKLFAVLIIALRANDQIPDFKIIETYARQVSSSMFRFESERKLNESKSKFKYLFENVNDIYYETRIDGTIEMISPSFVKLTSYTDFEIKVLKTTDFYVNQSDREVLLNHLIEKGSVKDYELTLKDKNGKHIEFSVSASMIKDSQGNPYKICGALRDISARKETERNLIKAIQTKDKFFSIISHDLRSPLSGFIGLTKTLVEDYDSLESSEIKEISQSLFNSADKVYQLLENLLNWAKLQQDNVVLYPKTMKLHVMIDSLIALNLQSAHNKKIKIFNLTDKSEKIFCDEASFQTIIRNLLSNAIKFTNKGGEILIKTEEKKLNFIEIIVEDNGIGIEEENISKLFTPELKYFRQGTEGESSSGLGLTLCKDLAIKNHGDLLVESKFGKGSKFILILPKNELIES